MNYSNFVQYNFKFKVVPLNVTVHTYPVYHVIIKTEGGNASSLAISYQTLLITYDIHSN